MQLTAHLITNKQTRDAAWRVQLEWKGLHCFSPASSPNGTYIASGLVAETPNMSSFLGRGGRGRQGTWWEGWEEEEEGRYQQGPQRAQVPKGLPKWWEVPASAWVWRWSDWIAVKCLSHTRTHMHTHAHTQSLSGAPRVPLSSPGCGGPSTGGWGAQPP